MHSMYALRRTNDQWLARKGRIFGIWAIFNPNGPTVYCVGCTDCGEDDTAPVFARWLNPFSQGAFGLGCLDMAHESWPLQLSLILRRSATMMPPYLRPRFSPFTCVPSFLSMAEEPDVAAAFVDMLRAGLQDEAYDWGKDAALRSYFGQDLFARAGWELRMAVDETARNSGQLEGVEEYVRWVRIRYGMIPTFKDPPDVSFQSSPFTEQLFDGWLQALRDRTFYTAASIQFAHAWVGAIDFVKGGELATAVDFESLQRFLWHFQHPLWPQEWTSDTVREQMRADTAAGSPS